MTITFSCPNPDCRRPFTVEDEFAGKKARCSGCQAVVTIPATKAAAPLTEARLPLSAILQTRYYYTDAVGRRQGPVSEQELKNLITQGVINPRTQIETGNGHKRAAGQIHGLFVDTPSPFVLPTQAKQKSATASPSSPSTFIIKTDEPVSARPPTPKQLYCTNCGKLISEQAVACMSCGAKPTVHKKFCRQCGVGLNPEQVVCVKCGSGIKGVTQNFLDSAKNFLNPFTTSPPNEADGTFDKALAKGCGKRNSAILVWWAMWIGCAIAVFVTGMYQADNMEYSVGPLKLGGEQADNWRFATFLVSVSCLVFGVIYHRSIAGTYVQVDESGIEGKGVGKYFLLGDPRLFSFRLAYGQISSVDATGTTIIVHASGTQYKCYVANPTELQRIIVQQQRKSS